MAAWPSISPTQSQDSSCGSSSISPADSYGSITASSTTNGVGAGGRLRRSPNFRKKVIANKKAASNNRQKKESTVVSALRVVVLASLLVFILVCVLQSQHLVIHDDGLSQTHLADHPGLHPLANNKREWKVQGTAPAVQVIPPAPATTTTSPPDVPAAPAVPAVGSFDGEVFQSKLTQWRQKTHRLVQHQSLQRLREQQQTKLLHGKASPTSRLLQGDNTTKPPQQQQGQFDRNQLYIPFWDQQALYRRRNSWHIMTVILADDCIHNYRKDKRTVQLPTLLTLKDALRTHFADVVVYFPQTPKSKLFPTASELSRKDQQSCQATLQAMIRKDYAAALESGQLQLLEGVINPLPPRVAYEYHHHLPAALKQLDTMKLPPDQLEEAKRKIKRKLELQQLQIEIDYSLGLDFAYAAELVYEYGDLFLFLRAGTTLNKNITIHSQVVGVPDMKGLSHLDYGRKIVAQYENFQQRLDRDMLVHRFCYMSFLQQDEWIQLPNVNQTAKDLPPPTQKTLNVPTGIVLERHGLYRMSMVLRSLLPYRKSTTTELLMLYCDELLWESQVLRPVSQQALENDSSVDDSAYPPALFVAEERISNFTGTNMTKQDGIPEISSDLIQKELTRIQRQQQDNEQADITIPSWVTVDNRQLGPQRTVSPADLIQLPPKFDNQKKTTTTTTNNYTSPLPQEDKKLVTFVIPTSTRPNGVKNQYVTYSLNQLFPLIRKDFKQGNKFQATVLLVICGNTQEDLDDHQKGIWDYYGPEIKEGILEVVSTNLETYPSLHNVPNNYNDPDNRLRWRSKQNLDISSSLFAAKGKSEYIMLLEDDTGYREKFITTLKDLIASDQKQEDLLVPKPEITGFGPFVDDFRQHIFAQVHFGFGYSGVLIHDDDALVYATLHYALMDEKPCDLLYLANYLQGAVLDQKWRWQLKRVLLTHLGSVSSLKGKIQPVWGLKG